MSAARHAVRRAGSTTAAAAVALGIATGAIVFAPGAAAAVASASASTAAAPASTAPRAGHRARAALPPGNFVVEWRLQRAAGSAPAGAVVITSGSAAVGGSSGYGSGAVVVGTAPPATPQSVRVANGHEAAIRFDQSETHLVYDWSYAAQASSESSSDTAGGSATGAAASGAAGASRARSKSQSSDRGASGHEVTVHRVDGLRVTPHWTSGDSLDLDVELTHVAPGVVSGGPDARASRDLDVHSTVRLGFDEWQTVATSGDGGEELQVRVSWR